MATWSGSFHSYWHLTQERYPGIDEGCFSPPHLGQSPSPVVLRFSAASRLPLRNPHSAIDAGQ